MNILILLILIQFTSLASCVLFVFFILVKCDREYAELIDHRPPTASVKKKAPRVGLFYRYVKGVYHCEPCKFAAHFFTVGVGPCPHCGEKIYQKAARWSKLKRQWVFRKKQQHRGPVDE